MSVRTKWVVFLMAAMTLLAGCGTSSGDDTPSPKSPSTAEFDTKVSLGDLGAACQTACDWLPTQIGPSLVKGESVSLTEQWPKNGDAVHVVCQTTGESFRDELGVSTDKWYGIVVPPDKVNPGAEKKVKRLASGYLAYVGAAWLTDTDKVAPRCA